MNDQDFEQWYLSEDLERWLRGELPRPAPS
jgi:hypothetical protein